MSKSLPSEFASVSVIVPCYECASTLERAVASVANQSLVPAELILVDDCSGVETGTLINSLAQQYRDGWICIIKLEKNMGAASARNAGWAEASQDYVAFLDSDDAWHPEKIELQFSYMKANPKVFLSGHAHLVLSPKRPYVWNRISKKEQVKIKHVSKWDLLFSNRFITPSAMLRRDTPHRFVEHQRYMEDHMLWLNIVCSGATVVWLSSPLAAIFKRPYGQAGLSAQWLRMQLGDLGNYRRLLLQNHISRLQFFAFALYSCAKFIRRLIVYGYATIRGEMQ